MLKLAEISIFSISANAGEWQTSALLKILKLAEISIFSISANARSMLKILKMPVKAFSFQQGCPSFFSQSVKITRSGQWIGRETKRKRMYRARTKSAKKNTTHAYARERCCGPRTAARSPRITHYLSFTAARYPLLSKGSGHVRFAAYRQVHRQR